jgi:hypothetical protein
MPRLATPCAPRLPRLQSVYGVDFSGARLAGRTTWVARCEVVPARARRAGVPPLRLAELTSLERLAGSAEREPALAHLVSMIRASTGALWAVDAPFGLPVEVLDAGTSWTDLVRFLGRWEDGAYALGLWALERGRRVQAVSGGTMHVRRATDAAVQAPFDPYHYRIIYQTFHGIRDVAGPLARVRETAVLPFQYHRVARARRVVVETCPSSTLRRLGLPTRNYKQPEGGPLLPHRRRTRRAILGGLGAHVAVSDADRRRMTRDPGGDALDAVVAAVGGYAAWRSVDHAAVARCARSTREGFLYV